MTPKFELGHNFCAMHLTTKFNRPTFNRSEVIVLRDKQKIKKQMLLKASTSPVGNKNHCGCYYHFTAIIQDNLS